MATKANIIKVYAQADSAKKVDIIIRYYPNFMGIVYESAQQRIHRAKRKIKVQMVGFLDGNIGGM